MGDDCSQHGAVPPCRHALDRHHLWHAGGLTPSGRAVRHPVSRVEYLGDTVETLAMAARRGFRIEQVPVAMRVRAAGKPSHTVGKATVYLGRALAVLLLALIRR